MTRGRAARVTLAPPPPAPTVEVAPAFIGPLVSISAAAFRTCSRRWTCREGKAVKGQEKAVKGQGKAAKVQGQAVTGQGKAVKKE